MRTENVALIPECAECERPWLPVDEEGWRAYLTCDEPPELAFYCPGCAEREFGENRGDGEPLRALPVTVDCLRAALATARAHQTLATASMGASPSRR
jgi:hypothetical protein